MCGFWMENSDFWTSITSHYESQTYNLSFCACKTAWFAPEWQVCIGSSPHLCFFFMQNSVFRTRLTSLHRTQTSSVVLRTHNNVLSTRITRLYGFQPSALETLVSIGPSPHLRFLHANQRLLDENYMSLWATELTCDFLHAKQRT